MQTCRYIFVFIYHTFKSVDKYVLFIFWILFCSVNRGFSVVLIKQMTCIACSVGQIFSYNIYRCNYLYSLWIARYVSNFLHKNKIIYPFCKVWIKTHTNILLPKTSKRTGGICYKQRPYSLAECSFILYYFFYTLRHP